MVRLFFLLVFLVPAVAWAVPTDDHADSGLAFQHCYNTQQEIADYWTGGGLMDQFCTIGAQIDGKNNVECKLKINGTPYMCQAIGEQWFSNHLFPVGLNCGGRPDFTVENAIISESELFNGVPTACKDGCQYLASIADGVCIATQGGFKCDINYTHNGTAGCNDLVFSGGTPKTSNEPPTPAYDCTSGLCTPIVDGGEAGGGGTSVPGTPGAGGGGGQSGGSGGSNTGGNYGSGDGDPTTSNGTGNDGAGNPGVDCNPLSNADCGFAGYSETSGDCDVWPNCDGDPVGCAQVQQTWLAMCYGKITSLTMPGDCTGVVECEGNPYECADLQMHHDQFCKTFKGDGSEDTNVFDDEDFGLDLKASPEVIDVSGMINTSGFGGAGACPEPLQVSVFGSAIMIPLDLLCSFAAILKPMVVLSALLMGWMIIGGKR